MDKEQTERLIKAFERIAKALEDIHLYGLGK